jgi:hypothetical protein
VLQNEEKSSDYDSYHLLGDRGPNSQSSSSLYDPKTGVLFYTQINKNSIQCWNTRLKYSEAHQDTIASNSETLIFINDLKIDANSNLWAISNRMPVFVYGTLNYSDYNFRIFSGRTEDLVEGTKCDSKKYNRFSIWLRRLSCFAG